MKAAVLHKVHDPMTIEDFDMPKIAPSFTMQETISILSPSKRFDLDSKC